MRYGRQGHNGGCNPVTCVNDFLFRKIAVPFRSKAATIRAAKLFRAERVARRCWPVLAVAGTTPKHVHGFKAFRRRTG
jgi:hypothetical protein